MGREKGAGHQVTETEAQQSPGEGPGEVWHPGLEPLPTEEVPLDWTGSERGRAAHRVTAAHPLAPRRDCAEWSHNRRFSPALHVQKPPLSLAFRGLLMGGGAPRARGAAGQELLSDPQFRNLARGPPGQTLQPSSHLPPDRDPQDTRDLQDRM